ncbi:MAG: type IV secretory system conjugative DNA transfer family protein [Alphaproteobacteria bacterium]
MMKRLLLIAGLSLLPLAAHTSAQAQLFGQEEEEPTVRYVYDGGNTVIDTSASPANTTPLTLLEIQAIEAENKPLGDSGMPLDVRMDALREAAISYGARAGLAARSHEIRLETESRARHLDKIFNFSTLLIPAPSGLLIEPPIVSESINAMLIQGDGQQAAVSDRMYNIINNARIVSAARHWRTYLERDSGATQPPPDILLPADEGERGVWIEHTAIGWEQGVRQADEIFEADLNLLTADYEGMIRYRSLLAQGMISQPYALQVDRGVTGGGDEMRIGDRAVQITGVPEFNTGHDSWQPASR